MHIKIRGTILHTPRLIKKYIVLSIQLESSPSPHGPFPIRNKQESAIQSSPIKFYGQLFVISPFCLVTVLSRCDSENFPAQKFHFSPKVPERKLHAE